MEKGGHLVGGTLLVAGTAIGGGMLALPVLTAAGGFIPALVVYFLCWLFMACTGILMMEVFLWMQKEANIVSMAKATLGKWGRIVAWCLYLFLFYSLTVAYVSGGGNLTNDLLEMFNIQAQWVGPLLFVAVFAPFVYFGAAAVDKINQVLMLGLILSFLLFIFLGAREVQVDLLKRANLPLALFATPVVFTSFGFQGIVPTLTEYMGRNPFRTRLAIFWGSAIPLVAYMVWEWLILGIVPLEGSGGLLETLALGQSAVYPLKNFLELPWLYRVGEFFAFFAIVTSFLGVTIGLLDFLADGFKVKKSPKNRLWLVALIYLPPLAFAMSNPCLFLNALHYAGGLGCALLLGLLPIVMAYSGRYIHQFKSEYQLPGGRGTLLALALFVVLELSLMVIKIL